MQLLLFLVLRVSIPFSFLFFFVCVSELSYFGSLFTPCCVLVKVKRSLCVLRMMKRREGAVGAITPGLVTDRILRGEMIQVSLSVCD